MAIVKVVSIIFSQYIVKVEEHNALKHTYNPIL